MKNKRRNTQDELLELVVYAHPKGTVSLQIDNRLVNARAMLDSGSNVFLSSPLFCNKSNVPTVQQDDPIAIHNFAGEVVAGVGRGFTKTVVITIGNYHTSPICAEVGPAESEVDIIIPGGWWLTSHPISKPYESWTFQDPGCSDHCLAITAPKDEFHIEWDDNVELDEYARIIGMVNVIEDKKDEILWKLHMEYHELIALFMDPIATALPRHRKYDHSINLVPREAAP